MEQHYCNEIELVGRIQEPPSFSHRAGTAEFWQVPFHVCRRSGTEDVLQVLLRREQAETLDLDALSCLKVKGRVCSFNERREGTNRLKITVLAQSLEPVRGEEENRVRLWGRLCKPPVYRRTPLGREICDLLLAVPRRFGKADYLPCVVWGQGARMGAKLSVGAQVALTGRLQSRGYQKVLEDRTEQRTAYEISVARLETEPDLSTDASPFFGT